MFSLNRTFSLKTDEKSSSSLVTLHHRRSDLSAENNKNQLDFTDDKEQEKISKFVVGGILECPNGALKSSSPKNIVHILA